MSACAVYVMVQTAQIYVIKMVWISLDIKPLLPSCSSSCTGVFASNCLIGGQMVGNAREHIQIKWNTKVMRDESKSGEPPSVARTMSCFQGNNSEWQRCIWHRPLLKCVWSRFIFNWLWMSSTKYKVSPEVAESEATASLIVTADELQDPIKGSNSGWRQPSGSQVN